MRPHRRLRFFSAPPDDVLFGEVGKFALAVVQQSATNDEGVLVMVVLDPRSLKAHPDDASLKLPGDPAFWVGADIASFPRVRWRVP